MKRIAKEIGVDSGTIVIVDRADRKLEYPDSQKVFKVPNGRYKIKWMIPESWNGKVEGTGLLEVKTGEVLVSDPCYFIREDAWYKILDETDYFKNPPYGWVILDKHGGDGSFNVYFELKKEIIEKE